MINFAVAMSIDDIKIYLDELQSKIDGGTTSFAKNDDGARNAAVIISMLKNASNIYMFCGAASVFSESFFHNISADNPSSPRYSYASAPDIKVAIDWGGTPDPTQDIGKYLRNMMNASLEKFLSDNNTINIIIEDKNKMADKKFLPSIVKNCMGEFKDNVKIYVLKNPDFFRGFIDHFSFALNHHEELFMARMENDEKSHKADCIFYPSVDIVASLKKTYSNFASVSSKL